MDSGLIGLLPDAPLDLPGVNVDTLEQARARDCTLVLGRFDGKLSLKSTCGKETPVAVEFSGGKQGYRLAADRVRHERLVKALGGMPEQARTVVDGTGGLGRDALVLVQAGFSVQIIERSPVVHALLADGIRRLERDDAELAQRITLHLGESTQWLSAHNDEVFAVYLDPMFPQRQKSAAVKKDLLWLQQLEQAPDDAESVALLQAARQCALKRVVVKRPVKAPPLAQQNPSYALTGKAVRFDIYLRHS